MFVITNIWHFIEFNYFTNESKITSLVEVFKPLFDYAITDIFKYFDFWNWQLVKRSDESFIYKLRQS